jgi:hypothetical protein
MKFEDGRGGRLRGGGRPPGPSFEVGAPSPRSSVPTSDQDAAPARRPISGNIGRRRRSRELTAADGPPRRARAQADRGAPRAAAVFVTIRALPRPPVRADDVVVPALAIASAAGPSARSSSRNSVPSAASVAARTAGPPATGPDRGSCATTSRRTPLMTRSGSAPRLAKPREARATTSRRSSSGVAAGFRYPRFREPRPLVDDHRTSDARGPAAGSGRAGLLAARR